MCLENTHNVVIILTHSLFLVILVILSDLSHSRWKLFCRMFTSDDYKSYIDYMFFYLQKSRSYHEFTLRHCKRDLGICAMI
jgi:hypothetical protein